MDTLHLLLNRQSYHNLTMPVPTGDILNNILQAALRVPDHGKLKPYQFTIITKEKMPLWEDILIKAIDELDLLPNKINKVKQICNESPLLIIVTAKIYGSATNIPNEEKVITAGCAAYAIQLAAKAYGFDSFWFTGAWTKSLLLKKTLGVEEEDKIVAFLKIGTRIDDEKNKPEESLSDFVNFF